MIRFVIHRLLISAVVLWLISVAVFALFYLAPADPARVIAGRLATPATVAAVRHRLGLDLPVPEQYGHFLIGALHGDLGYSYYNSEPVRTLILARLPVTTSLTFGAAVIWLVVGIGAGVLSARRPRTLMDRGTTLFVVTGLSMPTFLVGLLLLYVLFFRLHLLGVTAFPGGGYVPLGQSPVQWALHLILPWVTLAVVSAASYTRLARTSLLEVFGEDYVRTARAKGITERRVVYRHALRSALTPLVTQLGVDVGTLLGGAIVTETVFGLPGLGQLAVQSITTQDLPVIVGIVLLAALFVIAANMVVDLCYAVIDPRVRVG
jgi:peptide/nickel transport system permease protein